MLHAAEILQRHPQGCWVFDARWRRLDSVFACNPETGEVLRYAPWNNVTSLWLWGVIKAPRWAKPWLPRRIRGWGCATRHGFWPAPLHLVPKPAPPAAWPAGPICDSQRYIVGNGDREDLLP